MKRIIIISSYPSGQREIDILNRCIDGFKPMGYDIMIVSHLPIDEQTAKKVQYTIYDSNNTFLPAEYTPFFWFNGYKFKINIFNAGHSLPICRNIRAGISLAKAMGYEEFIFTECDIVLTESDAFKLSSLVQKMSNDDKKMLFFRPEEYRDCENSYVYETVMFAGNTGYFLDKFTPPLNVNEWLAIPMGYTLELSMYERLGRYESDFMIINDHSSNIFVNSEINLLRYGLFNCEIVYNEQHPDEPLLYMMNILIIPEVKYIEIFINKELRNKFTLGQNEYWFNTYKFDDSEIKVDVYSEDKSYLFLSKTFVLNQENSAIFKLKGKMTFE